jgi:N-formylglutamate amidohydrolase
VIDLNRNPDGAKLYHDSRQETSLVPSRTFEGDPLYKNPEHLNAGEIERRMELYFKPYHAKIAEILAEMKKTSRNVIFFDGHSIKRQVSTIQSEPFPDLILGNADGKSAHPQIIETALGRLKASNFQVTHNHPFKGGYLTRSFGKPAQGIHALQLEMSQDIYMDELTTKLVPAKQKALQKVLTDLMENLIRSIQTI